MCLNDIGGCYSCLGSVGASRWRSFKLFRVSVFDDGAIDAARSSGVVRVLGRSRSGATRFGVEIVVEELSF